MNADSRNNRMVWDPLVRVFHWSLVLFFFLAYFLVDGWPNLHGYAGYTVILLVLFRVVWGLIGSTHARFADFVVSPKVAIVYLQELVRRRARPHEGHNPAGAAMILALLISLLAAGFTGVTLFAMEGSGPFANTFVAAWPAPVLEKVHAVAADLTMLLIVIHVAGVLFTSVLHRQNLIAAMITGRKSSDAAQDDECGADSNR